LAGKSGWLPFPLVPLDGMNEMASGEKQPEKKSEGQVAAQTIVDCGILATPGSGTQISAGYVQTALILVVLTGLVGCIAAADSIATGKSFAESLTNSFRVGPKPKESPYKPGW
jgi:hypothetical protein